MTWILISLLMIFCLKGVVSVVAWDIFRFDWFFGRHQAAIGFETIPVSLDRFLGGPLQFGKAFCSLVISNFLGLPISVPVPVYPGLPPKKTKVYGIP